jgi:hypothetical protein
VTRKPAIVLAVLTVLSGAGVLTGPAPVSLIAGLLLAFGLPGAALVAVLFRTRGALSGAEWFLLVPALSLAALVLGGLVAWAAGLPLDQHTWLGVSGTTTLVALIVATARPARPAPISDTLGDATQLDNTLILQDRDGHTAQASSSGYLLTRVIVPFALVALLAGGAAWLSLSSSRGTHDDTVTALSVSPPGTVDAAGNRVVRVTATGLPVDSTTYRVIVTDANGSQGTPRAVVANDQGTWTEALTVPGLERITIGLYQQGRTTPFRELILAAATT